jgi:hypothetical protein
MNPVENKISNREIRLQSEGGVSPRTFLGIETKYSFRFSARIKEIYYDYTSKQNVIILYSDSIEYQYSILGKNE